MFKQFVLDSLEMKFLTGLVFLSLIVFISLSVIIPGKYEKARLSKIEKDKVRRTTEKKRNTMRYYFFLRRLSVYCILIISISPLILQMITSFDSDSNKIFEEIKNEFVSTENNVVQNTEINAEEEVEDDKPSKITTEKQNEIIKKTTEKLRESFNLYFLIFTIGAVLLFIKSVDDLRKISEEAVDSGIKINCERNEIVKERFNT